MAEFETDVIIWHKQLGPDRDYHMTEITLFLFGDIRTPHVLTTDISSANALCDTPFVTHINSYILLVNKINRCSEFQFYCYYYSTCFGQAFCPSSGVLSRTSALVHFMQLWWPFATRNRMELYQSRCTAKNSWWWAETLPETCRVVIPIKLEFSASVGFIDKESVTMHGHTIVKINSYMFRHQGVIFRESL